MAAPAVCLTHCHQDSAPCPAATPTRLKRSFAHQAQAVDGTTGRHAVKPAKAGGWPCLAARCRQDSPARSHRAPSPTGTPICGTARPPIRTTRSSPTSLCRPGGPGVCWSPPRPSSSGCGGSPDRARHGGQGFAAFRRVAGSGGIVQADRVHQQLEEAMVQAVAVPGVHRAEDLADRISGDDNVGRARHCQWCQVPSADHRRGIGRMCECVRLAPGEGSQHPQVGGVGLPMAGGQFVPQAVRSGAQIPKSFGRQHAQSLTRWPRP